MRKILPVVLLLTSISLRSQTAETRNITPETKAGTVRFERIAASATGNRMYAQGWVGNKLMLFVSDGDYWRDVSKGSEMVYSVSQFFTGDNSFVYMYTNNDELYSWSEDRESGSFFDYHIHDRHYSHKRQQAIGSDRTGKRFFITGMFAYDKKEVCYVQEVGPDGNWTPVRKRKMSPEIIKYFETYQTKQVIGGSQEDIYVLFQQPSGSGTVIVRWNGKDWTELKPTASPVQNLTIDGNEALYANGTGTDGKDYLLKWNGAGWDEIGIEGVKKGTPIKVTADEKGTIYVGGMASSGKDYTILSLNGNSFQPFGTAPGPVNDMVVKNDRAYVIAGGSEPGIYSVPKGGQITAATYRRMATKKEKDAQRVLDFYNWYNENYTLATAEAMKGYRDYLKNSTKENAAILKNLSASTMSQFLLPARDSLKNMAGDIRLGDNKLFDFMKELNSEQHDFISQLGYTAGYKENMYYNNSDLKRDLEKLDVQYKKAEALQERSKDELAAYLKRNDDVVMRATAAATARSNAKTDANTPKIYEIYKRLITGYVESFESSQKTFEAVTTAGHLPRDQIDARIMRSTTSIADEERKLREASASLNAISPYELDPRASPFYTAFKSYVDTRLACLSSMTTALSKIDRTDLSKQVKRGYFDTVIQQFAAVKASLVTVGEKLKEFTAAFHFKLL